VPGLAAPSPMFRICVLGPVNRFAPIAGHAIPTLPRSSLTANRSSSCDETVDGLVQVDRSTVCTKLVCREAPGPGHRRALVSQIAQQFSVSTSTSSGRRTVDPRPCLCLRAAVATHAITRSREPAIADECNANAGDRQLG
jgi:hypothetical protein